MELHLQALPVPTQCAQGQLCLYPIMFQPNPATVTEHTELLKLQSIFLKLGSF